MTRYILIVIPFIAACTKNEAAKDYFKPQPGDKLLCFINFFTKSLLLPDSSSRNGFINGKSKAVKYTILSCDGKKLVMMDDSQNRTSWEK